MEKYCDTNLNYYIKVKLTEEGRIFYKKHYEKYNCEAPKLNIDDEGYVQFQIHEFMNIFGERLFMGATLPCETNCKIQVKDDWHYVKDGDLPKKDSEVLIEYGDNNTHVVADWISNTKMFGAFCVDEVKRWKEIIPPEGDKS